MSTKDNTSMKSIYEMYLSMGDPRVASWPMMSSPLQTIVVLILYLITLHFVREHMANRKPFDFKYLLVAYNAAQVCASFYVFLEVLYYYNEKFLLTKKLITINFRF